MVAKAKAKANAKPVAAGEMEAMVVEVRVVEVVGVEGGGVEVRVVVVGESQEGEVTGAGPERC